MKYTIAFLFAITQSLCFGQVTFSGEVYSSEGSLIGATVELYKLGSTESYGALTESDGSFVIENIDAGQYSLVIQYLGFEKYKDRLDIKENDVEVGRVVLKESTIEIDGVEIKGTVLQAIQKGDTTVFNAAAFQTLPDADAKDLIAKIPGIVVSGGTIQAMGEDVKRVTVDGKDFFSNDPNVALSSLPAEIIQKVEVIDEQSDESRFSGFNDGNTTKTINIITKPEKRIGEFGKVYGGVGENDRYQAGGNINFFNNDQRFSIVGMSNNINQQNFSSDDLTGLTGSRGGRRGGGRRGGRSGGEFLVQNQDGITKSNAAGINFNDSFGDKVDLAASYFFNQSDNTLSEIVDREYFSDNDINNLYEENNVANTDNLNHRTQARLEVKFSERAILEYRPRFSWQDASVTEDADLFLLNRGIDTTETISQQISEQSGYSFNHDLRFRYRFAKRGRTASIRLGQSFDPDDGSSDLDFQQFFSGTQVNTIQTATNEGDRKGINLGLSYSEPIGKNSRLMTDYRFSTTENIEQEIEFLNDVQNDVLSNELTTNTDVHTGRLGYQYRKDKTVLMFRASFEQTLLTGQQTLPFAETIDKSFFQVLPFAMLRHDFSEGSNIRVFYRANTDNPSATQLSETLNNSNPVQLYRGNTDLNQAVNHSVFTRFRSNNLEKNLFFYAYAGVTLGSNYIGNRQYTNGRDVELYQRLAIDPRSQLVVPENLDGYLSMRSFFTLGMPVTALKSKFNVNVNTNYSDLPGIIDDQLNSTRNLSLGLGPSLTSNISDKVDFTISTTSNIGRARNDLFEAQNTNFLNQSTQFKMDAILPYKLTFRTNVAHEYFNGYGEGFDGDYILASLSLGKKIFKDDRGEISISVYDLFNQNQSIQRNVQNAYIESVESNVLNRYFMVNFRYDIRNFGQVPEGFGEKRNRRGPPRF